MYVYQIASILLRDSPPSQSLCRALQSACSVDRIDSALATVLPLVPGLSYFRFCCEDPRCGIELDEIDPEQWALLEVTPAYPPVSSRQTLLAPTTSPHPEFSNMCGSCDQSIAPLWRGSKMSGDD